MAQDADSYLVSFLGALQASIAVLLTIFSGVLGAQFNLLSEQSSKEISRMAVNIFMPALLITNIGSQMHLDTAMRYVPIIIYAIVYGGLSILLGLAMTKFFKMPSWVTPAIAFNNTTSLPLLLVQSLAATKLLDTLDPSGDAVARAKSYFLVNSMVGNSLTFSLGPKLLNEWNEDAPEPEPDESEEDMNGHIEEEAREAEEANEETSLLPNRVVRAGTRGEYAAYKKGRHLYRRLPPWTQGLLTFLYQFISPPVIGAALGALIGLVPALHRLFFNSQEEGGYFNAWLTSALENLGGLFAALQVVVVGVKLSKCLLRMKKGEENGKVQWGPFLSVTVIRFVVWPIISIAVIYALATRTGWLDEDPILWFSMMLMPAGPPALMLSALTDVAGAEEEEKLSIAKFLTIEYAISPLIFLSVVGSLKASEAALRK